MRWIRCAAPRAHAWGPKARKQHSGSSICAGPSYAAAVGSSEEHTSELQSPRSTLFPYTTLFRSGSGAPRREHTPGGQKQESSTAAQAYALAPPTPRQSGARASPAKAECPARQQTGHRTGLGLEGDLLPFLEVQIRDVGRRLSRLLVLPGHAEPPGADEKGGPHAARP